MQRHRQTRRARTLAAALESINHFCTSSDWARRQHEPGIMDFTFANPQEMPLQPVVDAFRQWSVPLTKDWFAYQTNDESSRELAAASLRQRLGVPFETDDVIMTNGAFAAISIGLKAVTDPGDEVIINMPSWPFYEALVREAGLVPVSVNVHADTFDLDIDAIARAITDRTRAIIVNSPNNPTGKIYVHETLRQLAGLLHDMARRREQPIYVISDEPYGRIVFDGRRAISPSELYPHTLVVYSYSKILLTPGQRIGYLALPTWMPEREVVRANLQTLKVAAGWTFPNALMLHALSDLEGASLDINMLQRKRDVFAGALWRMGYALIPPEGTFYLFPKSPMPDDRAFARMLAGHDIFVLPGSVFGCPGYIRISLTASFEMIDRSLSGFAAAIACVRSQTLASR